MPKYAHVDFDTELKDFTENSLKYMTKNGQPKRFSDKKVALSSELPVKAKLDSFNSDQSSEKEPIYLKSCSESAKNEDISDNEDIEENDLKLGNNNSNNTTEHEYAIWCFLEIFVFKIYYRKF